MQIHRPDFRSRSILSAVIGVLVLLSTLASPASAQNSINEEQRAALYARPAVVYLEHHWQVWVVHDLGRLPMEFSTSCTGFVVEENGYVVTAGHCVDPGPYGAGAIALDNAVAVLAADYDLTGHALHDYALANWEIEGDSAGSTPTPTTFVHQAADLSGLEASDASPARVIEFQPFGQGDVALLKTQQRKLSAIELRPAEAVNVGLPVLSIGYPGSVSDVTDFNFEPTFKDGRVSSTKTQFSYPVFEVSAALSQGMSGGPTVDLEGRVVGVNSFGPGREPQAFNFLSSVDLVNEMLSRNGVVAALGPIDTSYRAGVDAFLAGDYRAAITHFDDVIDRSPSHSQSADLRVQAQDAIADQGNEASGFPVVPTLMVLTLFAGLAVAYRKGAMNRLPKLGRSTNNATVTSGRQVAGSPQPTAWEPQPTRSAPPSPTTDQPTLTGWWTDVPTTARVDS